jgi:hypothetical protein
VTSKTRGQYVLRRGILDFGRFFARPMPDLSPFMQNHDLMRETEKQHASPPVFRRICVHRRRFKSVHVDSIRTILENP